MQNSPKLKSNHKRKRQNFNKKDQKSFPKIQKMLKCKKKRRNKLFYFFVPKVKSYKGNNFTNSFSTFKSFFFRKKRKKGAKKWKNCDDIF